MLSGLRLENKTKLHELLMMIIIIKITIITRMWAKAQSECRIKIFWCRKHLTVYRVPP